MNRYMPNAQVYLSAPTWGEAKKGGGVSMNEDGEICFMSRMGWGTRTDVESRRMWLSGKKNVVCMYVYMYDVCMYVCMYVSMYLCCIYVCMHVCIYDVCMYVCMYVSVCVCMYVCTYVCMYACMYVCMLYV